MKQPFYRPGPWGAPLTIIVVSLIFMSFSPVRASGPDTLYRILKDAQATNAASLTRGKMVVSVSYQPAKDRATIEFEATVWWDRDQALWIYKLSEPDSRDPELRAPLSEQPLAYKAVLHDKVYFYDVYDGDLFIYNKSARLAGSNMFDVLPSTNWFRCCPPTHDQGRSWAEMIGPDSPVMRPEAKISIEQVDENIVRQKREDPGFGFVETDFSLKYCGNVVKTTSFRPVPNIRSTFGQYTWRKTPKGICVLESCEFKRTIPGSTTDIDQTYRLTVKSIDLDADVSSATLSFSALKAYLPPNTMVEDRSGPESKSYPLYPALYNSDGADFRRLSKMIRSRGFLKNGE